MEQIQVDGFRIAYERAGSGPPVVLLHGFVADARTTWRRQFGALADEFTVVAWDAPGVGNSSIPSEFLGMAGYADCVAGFVQGLELGPVHVIGLSFGGALALELCRRHPRIPSTLVLVSAYAGWAGSLPPDEAGPRLQQALELSKLSPRQFVDALLPSMFSASAAPEDVEAFGASMLEVHPVGFRAMARASAEDLRDALPGVRVPTLLVYGDRDPRAPLYVANDLHTSIPTATLVVLNGAGHVCNVEAHEQFNQEVRRFLRENSARQIDR